MLRVPRDADLGEQRETDAVLCVAEAFDFFIRPRLLLPKVVGRKG
jgi:hypothetical protein